MVDKEKQNNLLIIILCKSNFFNFNRNCLTLTQETNSFESLFHTSTERYEKELCRTSLLK